MAGLGHLRVTDALVDSLPKGIPYELMGTSGALLTGFHRFISVNPFAKRISEAFQHGFLEDIFTKVYVGSLRRFTGDVYQKMLEVIENRADVDSVTVVATHFGLAHQIAAVKRKLERKTKREISIVVQVTDDTSMHVWCVRGADLTMVPSRQTKSELEKYAKSKGIKFNCEVSPYPTSPMLAREFPKGDGVRWLALAEKSNEPVNVMIPISGAAVGLSYLSRLITTMDGLSGRFRFWVVGKRTKQLLNFTSWIARLRWVQVVTGKNDREVVNLYEKTYRDNVIHLEVTKPSEQAFKALIPPSMIGGSVLLFAAPVGRQEYDNIKFLQRHGLVRSAEECGRKEEMAHFPRGILLPRDPEEAGRFVVSCLEKGYWERMTLGFEYSPESLLSGEINEKGTWLFWEKLKVLGLV